MREKQKFQFKELELGVCYYPEHWDKSLWEDDLKRMLQSGIKTIRIAEFAWSKFEPREGEFTFDFFDEFMAVCERIGMKVIFGTPTATPPAWLTLKYPEVLNANKDGVLYRHGGRRHYNYNSPKYREKSCLIVEKIAEHYGKHKSIVGWQIDNELNCEVDVFYSESDTIAFREFLKKKYSTLEALNEAWGTVFWNQTYTGWEEVFVPRTLLQPDCNPHMKLDYIRFVSDSCISFCRLQSEILYRYKKEGDFITTNGMFGSLDNHRMQDECLDVFTYDSYPNFAFGLSENPKENTSLNDRKWSMNLTEVRSVCPHFGIMEQQSGANGWNTHMEAPAPKPGQMMLWAMQSIAHGSDYISFFRWRTCAMGTEIYWHGILDYDNRDNRKLAEVKKIAERVGKLKEMTGAEYKAEVAVLKDYDNAWDSNLDIFHRHVERASQREIFVSAQLNHIPYDYLYLQKETSIEDLLGYSLLIYPHPVIATKEHADLLQMYVENGGTLIFGCRSGYKDSTGKCVMKPMPGEFAGLTGAFVNDFTFIGPGDNEIHMEWNQKVFEIKIFSDIIEQYNSEAKVLGRFADDYYKGAPALIKNKVGKGTVYFLGSTFTREIMEELFTETRIQSPGKDLLELSSSCELAVRDSIGKRWYIVLNYENKSTEIRLLQEMKDIDTGESVTGVLKLEAYETKVFTL